MCSIRPSVAIVGAGLGGLTLARILQLESKGAIDVTIYERDTSSEARDDQGGTLDMHGESGQRALRAAGLYDQFRAIHTVGADVMHIRNKTGKVVFDDADMGPPPGMGPPSGHGPLGGEEGGPGDRPEIDRGILRQLLLDSLLPGTVLWGHALRRVAPIGGEGISTGPGYQLDLVKRTSASSTSTDSEIVHASADYIVGADGTWSKVRPLLSPTTPTYAGVSFVDVTLKDVEHRHPKLAAMCGKGSMIAIADNKGLLAQRNSGDRIRVYIALRVPETWVPPFISPSSTSPSETEVNLGSSGIPFHQPAIARARLLELFADWSDDLKELITYCEDVPGFIPRRLQVLPVDHTWAPDPLGKVTLIGDAAHVMSPFAGEGANLAMLDATELATTLLGIVDKSTVDLRPFEEAMFTRANKAAVKSARNLDLFISKDAPGVVADLMKRMMSGGGPPP